MDIICGILLLLLTFYTFSLYKANKQNIRNIDKLQKLHKEKIDKLYERLENSKDIHIQENDFVNIIFTYACLEASEFANNKNIHPILPSKYQSNYPHTHKGMKTLFSKAFEEQYKYKLLIMLYPELEKVFSDNQIDTVLPKEHVRRKDINERNLFDIVNSLQNSNKSKELLILKNRISFLESTQSNLTAIPYMAAIMADYETYGLEMLAKELDWGYNQKRIEKVQNIREIRKNAQLMIQKNNEARYQLAYLIKMYPVLEDIIDYEYSQLPHIDLENANSNYDRAKDYLSKEEYDKLPTVERNQLALNRYLESHQKSKWQIGRDYELYCGYRFAKLNYTVDYFGSYKGLEDLGRDIIAKRNGKTIIAQCKYWSKRKEIHENHINQLYGTVVCYCIENNLKHDDVMGLLITNTKLSSTARKMADILGIKYAEDVELGEYPCIKCNIGHDDNGQTKIYHLPFDQQYDNTIISSPGEFFALTVAEAEAAGFRRAHRWFGKS